MKSNNNLSNAIFVCCRRLCNEFYAPFTPIFVMAAALAICSGRVTRIEEEDRGGQGMLGNIEDDAANADADADADADGNDDDDDRNNCVCG